MLKATFDVIYSAVGLVLSIVFWPVVIIITIALVAIIVGFISRKIKGK